MSNTATSQQPAPEDSGVITYKVLVECPLKKEYPISYVERYDTIPTLKHALNTIPDLCHYTCYHFEVKVPGSDKYVVTDDYTDLTELHVVDNTRFKIVLDNYNLSEVKAHVANLRQKLREPFTTAMIDSTSLETPEVVQAFANSLRQYAEAVTKQEEERLKQSKEKEPEIKPEEKSPVAPQANNDAPAVNVNVPKETPDFPVPKPEENVKDDSNPAAKSIKEEQNEKIDKEELTKSFKLQDEKMSALLTKIPLSNIPVIPDLTKVYSSSFSTEGMKSLDNPVCLKSISHSGWNPPPPERKMLGDLLYLDIETLEGETFYVTCTVTGFYVNKSRKDCFDPTPSSRPCHSPHLLGLLKQLSVQFRNQYKLLIQNENEILNDKTKNNLWDSISKIPIPKVLCTENWCVEAPTDEKVALGQYHLYDLDRAEGELLNKYSLDNQASITDWNEEYQMAVDLPDEDEKTKENLEFGRARVIYNYSVNFASAAVNVVKGIMEGSIIPLNPTETPENHFYLYNNILAVRICDSKGIYSEVGGDDGAYISANQDLLGVKTINRCGIRKLHTSLTTIVDYKGRRYVCQGLFPGLLQQNNLHEYGSLDFGNSIVVDEESHKVLKETYQTLGIGECKIHPLGIDSGNNTGGMTLDDVKIKPSAKVYTKKEDIVEVTGPLESKLIRGSDGRDYLIDLTNITPRDLICMKERKEKKLPNEIVMVRNEAIQHYYTHLYEIARAEAEKQAEEQKKDIQFQLPTLEINCNIGGKNEIADDAEKIKKDTETIENICKFIRETTIPNLVTALLNGEIQCTDSMNLCNLMHNRGINMRYLSLMSKKFADGEMKDFTIRARYFVELCETEMICRSVKHLLRELYQIKGVSDAPAFMLSELFNIIFGTPTDKGEKIDSVLPSILSESNTKSQGKHKRDINLSIVSNNMAKFVEPALSTYAPQQIWSKIEERIKLHFDYQLRLFTNPYTSKPDTLVYGYTQKLAILRRMCLMNGIKISSYNFDFTVPNPFTYEDIVDVVPIQKNCIPSSPLPSISQTIEQAYTLLGGGNYSYAYETIQQCVLAMLQVAGFVQEDMAICLATLGAILHNLGDIEGAIDHLKRSITLLTMLYGECNSKLCRVLESLAVYNFEAGHVPESIEIMKRVLYILDICSGDHNINSVQGYIRLGTMAREIGHIPLALVSFKEAVRRSYDDPFSQMSSLNLLALTAAINGQFEDAISCQNTYYEICKAVFKEDNDIVKEAKRLLERYKAIKEAFGGDYKRN